MAVPEAQLTLTYDRVDGYLVKVPYQLGLQVVDKLGRKCGAAIGDTDEDTVEFFIAEDDTADWPADVVVGAAHSWVFIPADRRLTAPGRHWARWMPRRERATSAQALETSLRVAAKDAS